MASSEVGEVTEYEGYSPASSPPPPYSAQMEGEAGHRMHVGSSLCTKEMMVGAMVQDEIRSQDKKTKLFVLPSDNRTRFWRRNPLISKDDDNNAAPYRRREGARSVLHAIFGFGDWPISKLRRVEKELEELKLSSASRIDALEVRLRAADTDAAAARSAATLAAYTAAADAAAAAAAADSAARISALQIEHLKDKLSSQASTFERDLAAATRIARLEERICVAGLRAEISALKFPARTNQRRNFSA